MTWQTPAGRRPGSGGGSCALTAGVDAGVADRFVLVAGRVLLQLLQDFFHRCVPSEDTRGRVNVRDCPCLFYGDSIL